MATEPKRSFKVVKFRIDKVTGAMQWREFTKLLRDVRYRVFRLANLVVSEKYLAFHIFRTGKADEIKSQQISKLSRQLRQMLLSAEKTTEDEQNKFSKTGILPDTVIGGLTQYRVRGLTTGAKWKQVINGETSLPTFRQNMAIPVRCDKAAHRRLEKMPNGDIELDLMVTIKPYPRVVLDTKKIDGSPKEILQL